MTHLRSVLFATLLLSSIALAQSFPAAGTVTAVPATARLDVDGDGTPDAPVVASGAHAGFCAFWAKQAENTNGLMTSVATALDVIDDLTPAAAPTRAQTLRELMPVLDVYNGTVNGAHVPTFKMPWTSGCTSGGGDLGGQRFAVRMRGNLHVEAAGTYTFFTVSDDGYELSIGGQVVSRYNANRSPAADSRRVSFTAPGVYPIELVYWDQAGQAVIELFVATSAICFSGATQGACAGAFTDATSVAVPASLPNFTVLSGARVAPATWAGAADTCAPSVGQPNTTCSPPAAVACGNGIVEVVSGGGVEGCDDGNTSAGDGCSATCTVEPNYVCGPPQLSACVPVAPVITAPASGVSTSDSTPDVSGTGVAGMTVTVGIDGAVACTAVVTAGGAWSCTVSPALAAGAHTAVATQADAGGRTSAGSAGVPFTVDTTAPLAPVLTAPPALTNDSTPPVSGTAEANTTVRVYVDGSTTPACTTTADASGAWSCDVAPALLEGAHAVVARATDAAGNVSPPSPSRPFVVDTAAPGAPVVTAPASGSTTADPTPTVSGTAEAGSTVRVFVDGLGAPTCTTVADATGAWSCDVSTPLANGAHAVAATATDAAGNTSPASPSRPFSVDTAAPTAPVVTAPSAGSSTSDATPTVGGTAEAGSTVRVFVDGSTTPACTTTASALGTWACDVSPALANGAHAVRATSTDAVGNASPLSAAVGFTVDTVAPLAPSVTAPANGSSTSDTTPTLSGTAEANATVRVFVDGALVCTVTASAAGTWTCTAPTLAVGAHAATATATDAAGNTSPLSTPSTFTVDTTAPTRPVVSAPTGRTSDATPSASGTAEAGATVRVYVDGSPTPSCTTTATSAGAWSCTLSPALADGAHTATATATDAAGNVSPPSTATSFTVDTSAPAAPVIAAPAENASTSDTTPTLSGTAEASATVRVFLDGSTTPACTTTADASGAWSCTPATALPSGAHTATATATDAAGNASPASAARHFTIDTAAPGAPVIASPAENAGTSDTTPALSGTAEAGATVRVFLDGSTTPACTATADASGAWACSPATALGAGAHSATATATDAAGNTSPSSGARHFTVDTSAPAVPVIASPAEGAATADSTPTLSGTAEADATVRVFVDGSATPACTATADASGAWSCTPTTALSSGAHTATATATDGAGNTSPASADRHFTIDTTTPAAPAITTPAADAVVSDATPNVSGTAEAGASVQVFFDGSSTPACTATADLSGAWSCAPATALAEGAHTATATATDAAGNTSPASPPRAFTVDTAAPTAPVISAPTQGAVLADATPQLTGTAEPGSTVTVFLDGAATPVCTVTASASGDWQCQVPTALADGAHTALARATDAGGSSSESSVRGFSVDTRAPGLPVLLAPTSNATTSSTPTFSGTAEPGATVSVVVDGVEVCTAQAQPSGAFACVATSPLSVGAHQATVTATDAAGNTSAATPPRSFLVGAAVPPGPPVVTAPVDGSRTTDSTPTVSGDAEPGSTVRVFVDGSTTPSCTATADTQGHFSCDVAPPLADGPHALTATATNTAGSSVPSAPVQLSVDATPPAAPVISSPQGNEVVGPRPLVSGTAEAGATVTVSIDGATVCTAQANAAGAWACAPSSDLASGAHTATATARDAAGNVSPASASVAFTVDVAAPLPAPVVTGPAAGAVLGDSTPDFEGTASPLATVSVFVDGSATPACVTTADASGHFRCTASVLPEGAHQVSATASAGAQVSPASASVAFTIDLTAPAAPVVTSPAAGAMTGRTPTLAGTAEAGSTVEVRLDGQVVCVVRADASGNWSCPVTQPLTPGAHEVTASALDEAGNRSAPSTPVRFSVLDVPRTPVLEQPAAGSDTTDRTPTFTGTAEPGSEVTVKVDGATVCTTTATQTGTFSCTATTELPLGAHTATVETRTVGGSASSSPSSFDVVDGVPAAPVLTSPSANAVLDDATPTFSGTAEPGSTVRVSVDGVEVCSATTDALGRFSCEAAQPLTASTHSATATATTATGTSPASVAVPFAISGQSPVILTPVGGSVVGELPTFTGTATPGSTVSILVDGVVVCTTTAAADGTFSCTPSQPLPSGSVSVTARSVEDSGIERTSDPLSLRVASYSLAGAGLGCSSTGVAPGWLVALLGLFGLLRSRRARAVVPVVLVAAGVAQAQVAVPGFELERVRLNPGARHGLLVESGDLLGRFQYRAAVTAHYQHDPLVVLESGTRVASVVQSRFGVHLSGAFGITEWLEVGAQLPVVLVQRGDDTSALGLSGVSQAVSVGTSWLSLRGAPLQESRGAPIDLAVGVSLGLPLGTAASFTKDATVSAVPMISLGHTFKGLARVGGSLSVVVRPSQPLTPSAATVSDEVGSYFSTGLVVSTLGPKLRGELSGRVDVPFTRSGVSGEAWVGVRYPLFDLLELYAVGGPGFGSQPGTPVFRVLAGVALAPVPTVAPAGPAKVVEVDSDGDGLVDANDDCPAVKGVVSRKGCPQPDQDGDGLSDDVDQCPTVAGVRERQGCPAPRDRDGDGVADAQDACPEAAAPGSKRGCGDADGDGLDDGEDACVAVAGLTELKGCPDPDGDGDGVVDRFDSCRSEQGPASNQGCPEKQKQLVTITRDRLVIQDKVYFATGKAKVLPRSQVLLAQLARILKEHPEVERVSIEGHTDDRGKREANLKLSQARAESVRAWLLDLGVEPARMTAKGFGPDRPVADNKTAAGREANRRVDFVIVGAEH